jgi:diguanylate cyclase (GGDEF)-like protein/PAS domain S-box-containing protein
MKDLGSLTLDSLLASFASLTSDAVGVAYRQKSEPSGKMVWVNAAFEQLFGYASDAILGRSALGTVAPEFCDTLQKRLRPHYRRQDLNIAQECLCRKADGSDFWASLSLIALPRQADGGQFTLAVFRDITALKERELAAEMALSVNENLLAESKSARERLESAVDTIPDPLVIWDKNLKLVACNSVYEIQIAGSSGGLTPGMSFKNVMRIATGRGIFAQAQGREEAWIAEVEHLLRTDQLQHDTRVAEDRIYRAHRTTAPNGDKVFLRVDVTELHKQKDELEQKYHELELARAEADIRSLHDDLTGLGNRRFLIEGLKEFCAARARDGGEVAALHVDLDRFKQINDTLGHAAGDHVLRVVAGRLRGIAGGQDLLARVGGDEFIVLRHVLGPEAKPEILAQRIIDEMVRPIPYEDGDLWIGASVGIAMTPLSDEGELLSNSDIALYRAKALGRGRHCRFGRGDRDQIRQTKILTDDILAGLEAGAFFPVYQPQIDARTGRLVALEALARWCHPSRGVLEPRVFLQAAIDLNVVDAIDAVIFDKAVAACTAAFDADICPGLSFNVSQSRLMSRDLMRAIEAPPVYPGRVTFELLETTFFEDQGDAMRQRLSAVRKAGLGIEVDGFGSGRASIVALEQIAPDRLKIDRRLTEAVPTSTQSAKLVKSIVDIGHALGIGVTAEGVETKAHARALAELGCDRLQGYHIGYPMPLEAILAEYDLAGRQTQGRELA